MLTGDRARVSGAADACAISAAPTTSRSLASGWGEHGDGLRSRPSGISAFPGIGIYHASKWALEGFSQALAQEVAPFGIKVTLVEPGGYSTDWSGSSAKRATPLSAYDALHEGARQRQAANVARRGDPRATREATLTIADAAHPPLRIFFGDGPLAIASADYAARLKTWKEWESVSIAAQGHQD